MKSLNATPLSLPYYGKRITHDVHGREDQRDLHFLRLELPFQREGESFCVFREREKSHFEYQTQNQARNSLRLTFTANDKTSVMKSKSIFAP